MNKDTVYYNFTNNFDNRIVGNLADLLLNGSVGIFPTDTVYGIGCNAFNEKSINEIFDIKKRSFKKPINVLVCNIDMVKSLTSEISNLEYKLMEKFWPGPLTIIFKKNNNIPQALTSGLNTIGIRMPENDICLSLIEQANVPLATTSANISNNSAIVNGNYLLEIFNSKVDFIIDSGISKIGLASTIVSVEDNIITILRNGPITKDDIITEIGGDIIVK